LRDFGAVHERLAPGFVTGTTMEGDDVRVVTFFNGSSARETLVGRDDTLRPPGLRDHRRARRHYAASAEVREGDGGGCRFVWTVDVLPDALAPVHRRHDDPRRGGDEGGARSGARQRQP
jgi:hypothetical protein